MFRIFIFAAAMLLATNTYANSLTNPFHRNISCVPTRLLLVATKAAKHFNSSAVVISAYRSPKHNRSVGGAKRSYHMRCQALDFGVKGVSPHRLIKYVATIHKGGLGLYDRSSFIHIDTGPVRRWHWH
jgi:uncharacterized protein YcbK (DUF882 family)